MVFINLGVLENISERTASFILYVIKSYK